MQPLLMGWFRSTIFLDPWLSCTPLPSLCHHGIPEFLLRNWGHIPISLRAALICTFLLFDCFTNLGKILSTYYHIGGTNIVIHRTVVIPPSGNMVLCWSSVEWRLQGVKVCFTEVLDRGGVLLNPSLIGHFIIRWFTLAQRWSRFDIVGFRA